MIRPEDEIIVDLSGSCTKDEAVAKLLGWMKGPIRPKIIRMTEHGISEDQLPLLPSMEDPLNVQLQEIREAASQAFIAAAETNATNEELEEKENAVTHVDLLIRKASSYMSDIDEELSKGEDSEIKIDPHAFEQNGITHITLRSLDRWAQQRYGISVLEDQEQHHSPNDTQAQPMVQAKEEDPNPEEGFTSTKARNVMTTFGFLVEAFAKTAPGFGGDKPNASSIARHIANLAVKAGGQDEMDNQSYEAIRKRIKQAIDTKNSYLKNFGK